MSDESALLGLQDPEFLAELRLQMLKFATLQLKDVILAEDAVQEAMLGALKNGSAFKRQAALKTWVFAVLKHKIVDLLRQQQRYVSQDKDTDTNDEAWMDSLFNARGHWHRAQRPVKWQQPDLDIERSHFWRVFDICLNALPEHSARFFMMREFLELSTTEICHTESISENNLNVTLYRARMKLRQCLDNGWFQKGDTP
ncbi:sigma-70 family RNA polymerase sigma factor [Marinobacterium sp. BA1]|uniref:sigma-70 family RNA polymerase sigma factor n=1 Tax=Marinobacterium sp. BA1 TaxID=3138931 RepID=UPI0032E7CDC5